MPDSAVFDDDNLVSCAGLVPVMALAEQTDLAELLAEKVRIVESKVKSGAANPAPKLATLIAGMCAGADRGRQFERICKWFLTHDPAYTAGASPCLDVGSDWPGRWGAAGASANSG